MTEKPTKRSVRAPRGMEVTEASLARGRIRSRIEDVQEGLRLDRELFQKLGGLKCRQPR